MTNKEFEKITKERLKITKELLIIKGKEYGREDRLHNFKRLGELQRRFPEDSLLNLCDKQYISLRDMVDDLAKGKVHSYKVWSEKIGDVIVYMHCLEALFNDYEKPILLTPDTQTDDQ